MDERINLREANQHLSRYVAAVEEGQQFVITRRGQPVARLVPVHEERQLTAEQRAALTRTVERMRTGYSLGDERVRRDALHER